MSDRRGRPRVLFVGGTQPGYVALNVLWEIGANLVGIVPTREAPHEIKPYYPAIESFAQQRGIYLSDANLPSGRLKQVVDVVQPDILFCTGYRRLISSDVLRAIPMAAIGTHFSLLPRYRGFAPVNWAIINGETETGVSLFHLVEDVDAGDIIAQRAVRIGPEDTAAEVLDRCTVTLASMLREVFPLVEEGHAPRTPQPWCGATYTCSRVPLDGVIDWSKPSRDIHNLVRALAMPFPGARTTLDGQPIIIWRTALLPDFPPYVGRIPGRVVEICNDGVKVLTGDSAILVTQVGWDETTCVPARSLVRSVRATFGR